MQTQRIKYIRKLGIQNTLDFEVGHKDHNFYAEGILVSNSHSLSTAKLGALTVWAKYKYPLQFYTACLNSAKNQPNPTDEIAAIEKELGYFNIKLLAPDIIKSKKVFTIENGNIRFSIQSIKGIADKTLEKLDAFKHEYSSKFDIFNSANEAKLGIGILSALIQSGCLSEYTTDIPRSKLVLEAQLYNILTPKEKKYITEIGKDFKYDLIEIIKYLSKPQNGNPKPFIKESRMETIRGRFKGYKQIYDKNSRNEKLASWFYEIVLLGYSYSNRLFDILAEEYKELIDINQLKGEPNDNRVTVGGQVLEVKRGTSKNKNKYVRCKINDSTGDFNVMIMEKHFEQNNQINEGKEIEEGDLVACSGRKSTDIVFCDKIVIQNVRIYSKLSELKNSEKINE